MSIAAKEPRAEPDPVKYLRTVLVLIANHALDSWQRKLVVDALRETEGREVRDLG
jgi:hypothetical protein